MRERILDPSNPTGPFLALQWRDLRIRAQKINCERNGRGVAALNLKAGGMKNDQRRSDGPTNAQQQLQTRFGG